MIYLHCTGLILLGMSFLCLVMYKKNKKRRNVDPDDIFSVGASTFFDQHFSLPNAIHLGESPRRNVFGIDNVVGPTPNDDPIT